MNINVDTQEVRRVAGQIRQIAGNVRGLYDSDVRAMKSSLQGNAQGETANAINSALSELGNDICRIAQSLTEIQVKLEKYAQEIEEADKRATDAIDG